jgi:AraC-like DNA-binding protein
VTYRERPAGVPGVVLWEQLPAAAPGRARILPDGCLDLIWDGRRLFIAGPDSSARWHERPAGSWYAALRFSAGTGPAMLGIPASDLLDQTPDLAQAWPAADVRRLAEQVAADPPAALAGWAARRARQAVPDPLGPRVQAMARAGTPAARMAERLGLSTRQLHRRCLPVFGYGPRRLARILRLGQALDEARAGRPLAGVAAACGYADQAHLCREVLALAGATPTALLAEIDTTP